MSPNAGHARPGVAIRGWRAFRRWRRARPFWGGLLTIFSGAQIFGTTRMSLGGLSFQMGPTGFLSWLIPTILIACGALMWFTPQHRLFYAIVGTMTAVSSLVAVNLGGFFVGLLLGMVGGALGFAWMPGPSSAAPPADADTVQLDTVQPEADRLVPDAPTISLLDQAAGPGTDHANGPPDPDGPRHGHGPRALAIVLMSFTLATVGLVAVRDDTAAQAAPCPPAGNPSPSTTSSDTPTPSPIQSPASESSGQPQSGGGTNPPPTAKPTATGGPTPRPTGCATGSPPSPSASASPSGQVQQIEPDPGQPPVNKVPSKLTGSKVTMYKLRLAGVVELPIVGGGTIRTLQFSMDRAVTDDFALLVPSPAPKSQLIKSSQLTVDGDVRFFATRFVGYFLGIKVVLTPDSPLPPDGVPLTLPQISFDDPELQLAFVASRVLTADDLDHRVV